MTGLVRYETARAALAECRRIDEVKDIRDKAEAMRAYGRMANDVTLEMDAADLRLRAERRLGILLTEQKRDGILSRGGRPKTGADEELVSTVTLDDLGIDKKLSARSQKVGGIAERAFEAMVARTRQRIADGAGKVCFDLSKEEKRAAQSAAFRERTAVGCVVDDLRTLAAEGKRFGVIYADPPWEFKVWSGEGKDRSADNHYKTGGLEEIKALPVPDLAATDCVLLMWAVMPELPGALDVIKAWGFEYKTCGFTWVKQNKSGEGLFLGMGYWTRANAEICLLATRGKPKRLDAGVPQAFVSPLMEHSRKPDEFAKRAERLVDGPYLELYARRPRDGWVTWGNEIPRDQFGKELEHDPSTGEIIAA